MNYSKNFLFPSLFIHVFSCFGCCDVIMVSGTFYTGDLDCV